MTLTTHLNVVIFNQSASVNLVQDQVIESAYLHHARSKKEPSDWQTVRQERARRRTESAKKNVWLNPQLRLGSLIDDTLL